MWGEVVVLFLWAVDKNLLSKIWALIAAGARRFAWNALTLYSTWKSPNDMVKDGYHVDEVNLIELSENGEWREIDVLRIFRNHIQHKTISKDSPVDLLDFIQQYCCDPKSNFQAINPKAQYSLVVSYTFDLRKYKIVYDKNIRFPLYSERQIRNKDLQTTGALTAGMLTLSEEADDGIDIYQHLKEFAGPMENFYADTEFPVMRKHLLYTGLNVPDNFFIKMLDLSGTEFTVRPSQQQIRLEKN
jgi:hypothetical protein